MNETRETLGSRELLNSPDEIMLRAVERIEKDPEIDFVQTKDLGNHSFSESVDLLRDRIESGMVQPRDFLIETKHHQTKESVLEKIETAVSNFSNDKEVLHKYHSEVEANPDSHPESQEIKNTILALNSINILVQQGVISPEQLGLGSEDIDYLRTRTWIESWMEQATQASSGELGNYYQPLRSIRGFLHNNDVRLEDYGYQSSNLENLVRKASVESEA